MGKDQIYLVLIWSRITVQTISLDLDIRDNLSYLLIQLKYINLLYQHQSGMSDDNYVVIGFLAVFLLPGWWHLFA